MVKKLFTLSCLGLAALLAQENPADAQTGPVREGLRRTGNAVVEGSRAAVRGTGRAIGEAGQAVRDTVNSPADAARAQVDRGERSELEVRGSEPMLDPTADASVNANAGPAQVRADGNLNANQQLNANGQIQGQLNDQPMDDRYQSGFRGVDGQAASDQQQWSGAAQQGSFQQGSQVEYDGRMHSVRHSRDGRPFICVRGCPVYLDQGAGSAQQRQAYRMNSDQMQQNGVQQGLYENEYQQPRQDDQLRHDSQQGSTFQSQGGYSPVPAPPTPAVSSDINAGARNLGTDAQTDANQDIRASQDPSRSGSANIDAAAGTDINAQQSSGLNTNAQQSTDINADAQQSTDLNADAQERSDSNATNDSDASSADDSARDQNQDSSDDAASGSDQSSSDATNSDSSSSSSDSSSSGT